MEERLATEHCGELLRDALEQLLDSRAVTDERGGHLETAWGDVTHGCLDVVRDPLDKVRTVLVLYVQHLLVNLRTSESVRDSVHIYFNITCTVNEYWR